MSKYLLFSFALLLFSQNVVAQERFLLLYQIGKQREARFYEKEVITFQLKGDQDFFTGIITGFTDNEIKFNKIAISLDSIQAIDIRRKDFSKSGIANTLGSKLITVGVGYLALDWFNRTVVGSGSESVSPQVLTSAGIMVGSGIILNLMKKRYFIIDPTHRVTIVKADKIKLD